MANCATICSNCQTPNKLKGNECSSLVSLEMVDMESSPSKDKTYVIHHNLSRIIETGLWIPINARRKHQTNCIRTTCYNIITFLPKNLFEQFHRLANIYFVTIIALNWIPILNAIAKYVAFLPLTIVLTITAIKDLIEDLKRWKTDENINNQMTEVYDKTSNSFIRCQWKDLSVGNIVRIRTNQTVPADILLLNSTSNCSTCYLDTAAIDGETNLKQKNVPFYFLNFDTFEKLSFQLEYDPPNDDIYHFYGRIRLSTGINIYSCDNKNFLLRGCVLKITDYVDGLIVYAGNQTKLLKSSQRSSNKTALIEKSINRDVIFSSIILIILSLISAALSIQWGQSFGDKWMFVTFLTYSPFENIANHFIALILTFVIMYQVMIPIALYVSLDLVRILQIYSISIDKQFQYEHPINCRTFTINEDLGQIGYIFSDKTGTLTQNKLLFKAMSIGGILYSQRSQLPLRSNILIRNFLTTLAICNTSFIVDGDRKLIYTIDYEPKYEGDNADDLVLCQIASNFGVRMISRSSQNLIVRYIDSTNTKYEDLQYEIVCLLPFDSIRRRMSIIVRLNNQIFLFIKGAECSIWPNLSQLNETYKKLTTEQHSRYFNEQGYRSLVIGYRELMTKDFDHWFQRYQQATNLLNHREEIILDLANEIETEIILSGLTAVEDKLQDGVPKTIQTLRCAGIKIWLLTGDKQETALSTAQAASLINIPQTLLLDMNVSEEALFHEYNYMIYYRSQLIEMNQQLSSREEVITDERCTHETIVRISKIITAQTIHVSLVVTGEDLSTIFRYRPKEFVQVASECQSVIFCRITAIQKRELVTIAKSILKNRILSIGDGENDVGMIRESHCGIAIYGREGSQAIAAADFVVDRFECLCRLLFVHGTWCFTRTSQLILFTFMHYAQFVFVLFYHQLFNGFSGIVSIHSMYLILYGSLFTVIPQCVAAVFDEHISAERALREPQLYQYTLQAKSYRICSYWINILDAVWQATTIFFIAYFSYANYANIDFFSFGCSLVLSMTLISMVHVGLQATRIDPVLISSMVLSILLFFVFTLIYDATCLTRLNEQSSCGVAYSAFNQPIFWFTNLFTVITALLPRFIIKCIYNSTTNPFLRDNKKIL